MRIGKYALFLVGNMDETSVFWHGPIKIYLYILDHFQHFEHVGLCKGRI